MKQAGLFSSLSRYRFLIRQLVERDFKTKYKRSVLGILWSFLNPLLTMAVQYIVFSTIFRSDIPNFVVYLLSGIVCFNFFHEATDKALTSIVGNAPLIPLLAAMLLTGAPVRLSALLLPLGVLCLFAVSLGVGLILASSMVFFRDTQFLWGC